MAVGGIDANPGAEIVTGAGPGGGPHVRVWSGSGIIKYQFFAYAQTFRGGDYVAVGDINGLKHGQVVTGAGPGGGPQVRVFDPTDGNKVLGQFYAFAKNSKNGVKVSAGDINSDGKTEIITQSNDVFAAATLDAPKAELSSAPPLPVPEASPRLDSEAKPLPAEASPQPPEPPQQPQAPEHPLFLGTDYIKN